MLWRYFLVDSLEFIFVQIVRKPLSLSEKCLIPEICSEASEGLYRTGGGGQGEDLVSPAVGGVEAEDTGGEKAELEEDQASNSRHQYGPAGADFTVINTSLHVYWTSLQSLTVSTLYKDLLDKVGVAVQQILLDDLPPPPAETGCPVPTLGRAALPDTELDTHLEPHHTRLTELEGFKRTLQTLGAVHPLQTGEDDGLRGAASLVQQLNALLALLTVSPQSSQVPGKHPKDGVRVHLNPEEEFLPQPRPRHVLARLRRDPERHLRRLRGAVEDRRRRRLGGAATDS